MTRGSCDVVSDRAASGHFEISVDLRAEDSRLHDTAGKVHQ